MVVFPNGSVLQTQHTRNVRRDYVEAMAVDVEDDEADDDGEDDDA